MYNLIKKLVYRVCLSLGIYIYRIKPTDNLALTDFFAYLRKNSALVNLIRIGNDSDGGYLLPNDLEGLQFCASPGVADSSHFEFQLASEHKIICCLADFSVNGPAVHHPLLHFTKKFISSYNDEQNLRLDDWVHACEERYGKGDLLLQMDVEGAEYPILQDVSETTLNKFRIIIIEFHNIDKIFDRNEFASIEQVFKKLLKQFYIVHIHPNNAGHVSSRGGLEVPSVLEFTFLRRDRVNELVPLTFEPHVLDKPNSPKKPDLVLPACWRN